MLRSIGLEATLLGITRSLVLDAQQDVVEFTFKALPRFRVPVPPVVRCPDGTTGSPCVTCSDGNATWRMCA